MWDEYLKMYEKYNVSLNSKDILRHKRTNCKNKGLIKFILKLRIFGHQRYLKENERQATTMKRYLQI